MKLHEQKFVKKKYLTPVCCYSMIGKVKEVRNPSKGMVVIYGKNRRARSVI